MALPVVEKKLSKYVGNQEVDKLNKKPTILIFLNCINNLNINTLNTRYRSEKDEIEQNGY